MTFSMYYLSVCVEFVYTLHGYTGAKTKFEDNVYTQHTKYPNCFNCVQKTWKEFVCAFFFAVAILSASQTFIHSLQTSSRYTNNNLIFILNLNSTERPTNFGPTTHNSNAVKVFVTLWYETRVTNSMRHWWQRERDSEKEWVSEWANDTMY